VKRVPLVPLVVLALSGCGSETSTCPESFPTSGTITLSSEITETHGTLQGTGFLFSRGGTISEPNSEGLTPDMLVIMLTDIHNTYLGPALVAPELRPMFCRLLSAPDADSARAAFESLHEVPDVCEELMAAVEINEIWAVITAAGKHAKLLVLQSSYVCDTTFVDSIQVTDAVARVTFEWVYQPNGSRQL
jgi:hypothetical protein